MKLKTILPFAVFALTFGFAVSQRSLAQNTPPIEEAGEVTGSSDAFAAVTDAMRAEDYPRAKKLLIEMRAKGLEGNQDLRWETFASRAALRGGDFDWLKEINKNAGLADGANETLIISAMRSLMAAELKQTRVLLDSVDKVDELPEISRRRYFQLNQRLEQAEGNREGEFKWADRMVSFSSHWNEASCRSCHDNAKRGPGKVTTFDYSGWWTGKRYVSLLQESKTAEKTRDSAQAVLAKEPDNSEARLKLAYASRALGDEATAQKMFASFPWAKMPNRETIKPNRFSMFP